IMTDNLTALTITAASLAFVHTVLGPDHYLPFIVMSRARKWTIYKTSWVTLLSGFGHVISSILLGTIGIGVGIALNKLEFMESVRGDLAAWLFVLFGLGYMSWGIYRAVKNKPHKHIHYHGNGTSHVHEHTHLEEHDHTHKNNITPWILFTIFFLGPCEPLIPLLMYPAAKNSSWGVAQVSIVFGLVTMLTMLVLVLLASYGLKFVRLGKMERFTHAIAGATILLSGIAILFLGL
ncbi:MAG: sulfite exporter TauE/SafE family protein, partial [Bacteroidales bacterium]|nr:sulfite exporter TauE/SafE family protein [Bacteroidales bacterium]